MAVDKTAPMELVRCKACGGRAALHHSRAGKWYVRCEKCRENKTEETISRRVVCQLWNRRNGE